MTALQSSNVAKPVLTRKAVVLARGLGTRMRQADAASVLDEAQAAVADSGVKALIPIDRPFLDYVLHVLADAGYEQVCLVIGPEHTNLRKYYGEELRTTRLRLSFAIQEHPRGTADAVAAAESFAGRDPFLMINSDNHYPLAAVKALRSGAGSGLAAFDRDSMIRGSNIPADRVVKFAAVQIDRSGHLQRIIEKPDAATLASLGDQVFLSMNCWRFRGSIFEACRQIKPSARGELEITDAVQYAIDQLGEKFRVLRFDSPVLDLSCRADVGPVAERLAGSEVWL
jgi:glucose-1-phosphate thymidylyltransferase